MMNIFAVITADVINSKKNQSLANIKKLNDKSLLLNKELSESNISILTNLTISRGDELQIVCLNISDISQLLRLIRFYFFPLKLRIGVGIGRIDKYSDELTLSSGTIDEKSWDLNGNAFFAARNALDSLKNFKSNSTILKIYMPNKTDDITRNKLLEKEETLNTIYSLIDSICSKWTETQWKYTSLYDLYNKDEIVAKKYNVTLQNVGKVKSKANWKQIKNSEIFVAKLLEQIKEILVNTDFY